MSGFRALPLLFACLLMYLTRCIIRRLWSINGAILTRDANVRTNADVYLRYPIQSAGLLCYHKIY